MAKLIAIATRRRSRGDMLELPSANVTIENGIDDDMRGRPGKRQVTILSLDDWQTVRDNLSSPDLDWTSRRANLLITGINFLSILQRLKKKPIMCIGSVKLLITGETIPCERMDEICPGLKAVLASGGRGGVTSRVLQGGRITVSDEIQLNYSKNNLI